MYSKQLLFTQNQVYHAKTGITGRKCCAYVHLRGVMATTLLQTQGSVTGRKLPSVIHSTEDPGDQWKHRTVNPHLNTSDEPRPSDQRLPDLF